MYKLRLNLYLEKPKSKAETYIMLSVTVEKKRHRISTGLMVKPSHWNQKSKTVKNNNFINTELQLKIANINEMVKDAFIKNIPHWHIDKDYIQEHIKSGKVKSTQNHFFVAYDKYEKIKAKKVTRGTMQIIWTLKKKLQSFEKSINEPLSFGQDVNIFANDFIYYLSKNEGLTNASINKYISTLKSFLRWAYDEEYFETEKIIRRIKPLKNKAENIYPLTESEVEKLEKIDLSNKPKLEKYRDFFLIECYSGQRFSDVNNLINATFYEDCFTLTSLKTSSVNHIPLIKPLKNILKKYYDTETGKYNFPKLSYTGFLVNLKEIAKMANLDREVTRTDFRLHEKITKHMKLYEAIGTHAGRQTFVTLSLKKGARAEILKRVTGHKTDKSFQIYEKFLAEDINEEMNRIYK